jgi:hypothetical protein
MKLRFGRKVYGQNIYLGVTDQITS